MKILALECSAGPASAAIVEDGRILAQTSVNVKITHSETLMPMVKGILDNSFHTLSDIDGFAVAAGPGSFTGIRIGIAAIKGLAAPFQLPVAAVSTLRAMAETFKGQNTVVCAVMDARAGQVYNALFEVCGDNITRLCPDRALMCSELAKEVENLVKEGKTVAITGDGTDVFYPTVANLSGVTCANQNLRFQSASSVGLIGEQMLLSGDGITAEQLLPIYLRLPQAERELKAKQLKLKGENGK